MSITVGQLEDRFAAFMRLHRRTMHRYFQSVGMFNGHPHLLFHIRRQPGITPRELAAHMKLSAATVTVSVQRLETAGLVRREDDQKDRRVTHLYLTNEGMRMDEACSHGRDFLMDTVYKDFTDQEVATLYALLDKMTVNLQMGYKTLEGKDECHETLA